MEESKYPKFFPFQETKCSYVLEGTKEGLEIVVHTSKQRFALFLDWEEAEEFHQRIASECQNRRKAWREGPQ